ncbi:MAG: delta-60 repeat domain-containing protein, partial [Actinomycetes bacterium]
LVRLLSYGVVDTSFAVGTGADAGVHALKLQADGKLLIGGDFLNFNGVAAHRLLRVSSSGAPDLSFDIKGGANSWVKAIEVQPDGKILIAGYFSSFAGSPRNRITRLTSTGALDPQFDTGSLVTGDLTITTTNGSTAAVLSATDGLSPDTTYGIYTSQDLFTHKSSIPKADHVTFTTGPGDVDGVVDNHITLSAPALATGPVDEGSTIVLRGAAYGGIRSMVVQSDGKILAVGSFRSFDGKKRKMIVRLRSDGSVDSLFNPGSGFLGYRVDAIARDSNSKILASGSFFAYGGNPRNNIVRINR